MYDERKIDRSNILTPEERVTVYIGMGHVSGIRNSDFDPNAKLPSGLNLLACAYISTPLDKLEEVLKTLINKGASSKSLIDLAERTDISEIKKDIGSFEVVDAATAARKAHLERQLIVKKMLHEKGIQFASVRDTKERLKEPKPVEVRPPHTLMGSTVPHLKERPDGSDKHRMPAEIDKLYVAQRGENNPRVWLTRR